MGGLLTNTKSPPFQFTNTYATDEGVRLLSATGLVAEDFATPVQFRGLGRLELTSPDANPRKSKRSCSY